MFISSLSPELLVEDPCYVEMIAAADSRLTTLSRSTLSRATSSRFQALHDQARAALDCVSVCRVNTDMWSSLANEPFGSFVVSWLDDDWELRPRVLRCAVLNGRHAAAAIVTFLLRVAAQFNLGSKIWVVRTEGASNCVLAGSVLGTAMREDGPIIEFLTVIESASASIRLETAATSGLEEIVSWYVREIGAPVVGDCEEVATLKRVVLSDIHAPREKECLRCPNPYWFGFRLAAVLCDPFTKTFAFGNKPGTAALARASALAVVKWMVERAASAKDTATPPLSDGNNDPPTKRPRTLLRS